MESPYRTKRVRQIRPGRGKLSICQRGQGVGQQLHGVLRTGKQQRAAGGLGRDGGFLQHSLQLGGGLITEAPHLQLLGAVLQ